MTLPEEPFALFPRRGRGMLAIALALSLLGLSLGTWAWLGSDLSRGTRYLGLGALLFTRRLRGLIEVAALAPVLALMALVLVRRISPAWLVPAMAIGVLLTARLLPGGSTLAARVISLDAPGLNDNSVDGDTPVIGLVVGKRSVAVPLALLARQPILVLEEFDQRVVVMANLAAGRVLAAWLEPAIKPGDLESVGEYDGALLIYNRRYGQFISGMSGLLPDGSKPLGLSTANSPRWTTAGAWRLSVRDAIVLGAPPGGMSESPRDAVVVFRVGDEQYAVPAGILPSKPLDPLNTKLGETPAAIVRDEQGRLLAFERSLEKDLFVKLARSKDAKGRGELLDVTSGSRFTIDGLAVDEPLKGTRLKRIAVEPAVSWAVLKRWCPNATRIDLP